MGYWGWRPLVCGMFISTWVAGCSIVTSTGSPVQTPTPYPQITLMTGRLPHPTAPPQAPSSSPVTLTPEASIHTPASLEVEPPICYRQRDGGLVCLGRAFNRMAGASSTVVIEVVLSSEGGSVTELTIIEQSIIPSGAFAPFSVSFPPEAAAYDHVYARLVSAAVEPPSDVTSLTTMTINRTLAESGGRVEVRVLVTNETDQPVRMSRASVTAAAERVIGYRVVPLSDRVNALLPAGESTEITIDVFLQAPVTAIPAVTVHVEGISQPSR